MADRSARYANADHSAIAYDPGDGQALIAMMPDDPRLEGVAIQPYAPPPPPAPRSIADILADIDALRAELLALSTG